MSQAMAEQEARTIEGELRALGENLIALLRATLESEECRSIERALISRLEQVNQQLTEVVENIRARYQNVQAGVREAWETAHGPQILREVELGLADSLHKINEAIARRARPSPAHEATPSTAAPEPPFEKPD